MQPVSGSKRGLVLAPDMLQCTGKAVILEGIEVPEDIGYIYLAGKTPPPRNVPVYVNGGTAHGRHVRAVLAGGPAEWKSTKQKMVLLSTTEAECTTASDAEQEAAQIRRYLGDISVVIQKPISDKCDGQSTIALTKNPVQHHRTNNAKKGRFHISCAYGGKHRGCLQEAAGRTALCTVCKGPVVGAQS